MNVDGGLGGVNMASDFFAWHIRRLMDVVGITKPRAKNAVLKSIAE